MNIQHFIKKVNRLATNRIPFLFIIDFEATSPQVYTLEEAEDNGYFYDIKGQTNYQLQYDESLSDFQFDSHPISFHHYQKAFEIVHNHIAKGNTYLLNLTFPSEIITNLTLEAIFKMTTAKYKLYAKDRFVIFSPECFVKIKDGHIYSYPMKGTIDSQIPNAKQLLLQNQKELWEHNTIVDLIRNDLAMVSDDVEVSKFRYIDKIKTHKGELLQVSSEIKGRLPEGWKRHLGELLLTLLPAGSISGAPKQKTVEIIKSVEVDERNYYTGIFGVFDGESLDSAVNIRFLEQTPAQKYFYRSGGGITFWSKLEEEYQELINKIYVPTF